MNGLFDRKKEKGNKNWQLGLMVVVVVFVTNFKKGGNWKRGCGYKN